MRELTISTSFLWVTLQVPAARLRQVAAICDDIAYANANEPLPYSFGSPKNAFDKESNKFLLGPTHTGLTCASFVLAVFEHAKLRLVKYSGWPAPNAEDARWQQSVLDALTQAHSRNPHRVSREHIDYVSREVGASVRYRPEQVAAAAALRRHRPISYNDASRLGEDIVRVLRNEPVPARTRRRWLAKLFRLLPFLR
jgi:hypothetical protein